MFEPTLVIQQSKDYAAWLRPNNAKNGFAERSRKQRDLDYFIVELRKEEQRSASGRRKVSLRTINPVVCVFSKWQKPLFSTFEEIIVEEKPATNRSFDSQLSIGGAFYAISAPHEDANRNRWRNVLMFVPEDDNVSLDNLLTQLKFTLRAAINSGAKFDDEAGVLEYIDDILQEYPLSK